MSKETNEKSVQFISTSLYTTEAAESREKVEEELEISDPDPERAEAVLNFDDTRKSE